ncbi:unnamed protein product [Staurois parvus]|uniref:Uncharacterized protein n=1 Tax=Staurois parvus TaxID=386267 RepID=A0ABN9C3U4_9NEOB|nr:unnamed protein product [Staurois parvus]
MYNKAIPYTYLVPIQ